MMSRDDGPQQTVTLYFKTVTLPNLRSRKASDQQVTLFLSRNPKSFLETLLTRKNPERKLSYMKVYIAQCLGAPRDFGTKQDCTFRHEHMTAVGLHSQYEIASVEQMADQHAISNGHVVEVRTIFR